VPEPVRPPLRHRRDGSALLGLLAVVFGLAWLAAGTHLLQLSAEGVLAVALMIVGATSVVTARTDWALSRRAWPVLLGAVLVFALILTSVSPRFPGGLRHLRVGSQQTVFSSWAKVPADINGSVGRTLVDFTALPPPESDKIVKIHGGFELVEVTVPPTLHVVVSARVGIGSINIRGNQIADGMSPTTSQQELNPGVPGPTLRLDINSATGLVRVEVHAAPNFVPTPPNPPSTAPNPVTTA
jgi:hypothetical protein